MTSADAGEGARAGPDGAGGHPAHTDDVWERLARARVVPVVTCTDPDAAPALASTLVRAGYQALEITLRTPAAWACVEAVLASGTPLALGVGTVCAPRDLEKAARLEVDFAVSPGATPALVGLARSLEREGALAWLPGVATVSEAMTMAEAGWSRLKLFPASVAGGAGWLEAVAAPLPELRFCPTGGVNGASAPALLRLPNVFAVGGSWMVPAPLVQAQAWEELEAHARRMRVELDEGARSRPGGR